MIPIWLSAILAALGMAVWMLTQKDYNIVDQWKNTLVTFIVIGVAWVCWWQVGIPFFGWEAGQFNIAVFGLAWFVPSLLDHLIPQLQKK